MKNIKKSRSGQTVQTRPDQEMETSGQVKLLKSHGQYPTVHTVHTFYGKVVGKRTKGMGSRGGVKTGRVYESRQDSGQSGQVTISPSVFDAYGGQTKDEKGLDRSGRSGQVWPGGWDGDVDLWLPLPPSTNAAWRSGRGKVYRTERYLAFIENVKKKWATLHLPACPLACPVAVRIVICSNRRDLDNNIKCLLDSLEGLAFVDDRQVVSISAWKAAAGEDKEMCLVSVGEARHALAMSSWGWRQADWEVAVAAVGSSTWAGEP